MSRARSAAHALTPRRPAPERHGAHYVFGVRAVWTAAFLVLLTAGAGHAETIVVTPQLDGGLERIEAAVAGDEVLLAPGVYRFRLALVNSGSPGNPIVIRALDPSDPPVFDYSGAPLTDWPGGTNELYWRAAWVVSGDDLDIRSIAFRGTSLDGGNPAAVRVDGARVRLTALDVRSCAGGVEVVFGRDVTIEDSRFDRNGTHLNLFGGGPVVARGNLMTDSEGFNVYSASGDVLLEANWFARSGGFGALFDTCAFACGGTGNQPLPRRLSVRGNVWVQNTTMPNGTFFVGVLGSGSPSTDGTGLTQPSLVDFSYNTFVGRLPTPSAALLINADALHQTQVSVTNNAFENFGSVVEDISGTPNRLDGGGNWVTGAPTVVGLPAPLVGDAGELTTNFRPLPGSGLLDQAIAVSPQLVPSFEFKGDESTGPGARPRVGAKTIGAFEFGSAPADAGSDAGLSSQGDDGGVSGRRTLGVSCSSVSGGLIWLVLAWGLRRRTTQTAGIRSFSA